MRLLKEAGENAASGDGAFAQLLARQPEIEVDTPADPGADVVTEYTIDWGDGSELQHVAAQGALLDVVAGATGLAGGSAYPARGGATRRVLA